MSIFVKIEYLAGQLIGTPNSKPVVKVMKNRVSVVGW